MIKYPLYVTLDTNIFMANKYDFSENSTLGLLVNYVLTKKIKVVLSNIVLKEVEKNIIAESSKICGAINKLRKEVLKTSSEEYLKQNGLYIPLTKLDKKQYEDKSCAIWRDFIHRLEPEVLDISKIDLDTIITDYFNINPPFENSDKKRKEFPDAFIANQIRHRFINEEIAIISNDNGFKRACGNSKNYLFFKSLGELYDVINAQEAEYREIVQSINLIVDRYIPEIKSMIMDNEYVEINGLSYDKDGITYGFDYSDIEVVLIYNTNCRIRTIDEITEEKVLATILCTSNIDAKCSYEDYDNAVWDHETESYYFLETRKNLEKHSAKFSIRIEENRKTNTLKIMPFKVILNGDTLCDRLEIDEDDEYDSYMDIINQDREDIGLCALDGYSDYLEDKLSESAFMTSIVSVFEKINSLYGKYEEMTIIYDEFIALIENNKSKDFIKQLSISMNEISEFPMPSNMDAISEEEIDKIISWADQSYDRVYKLSEQPSLPDYFSYGQTIEIHNGEEIYTFVIGKLSGTQSAGNQESIDLSIKDKTGDVVARGYVMLTVGYLDFDEDGSAGMGIADDIEYCCDTIVNALDDIARSIDMDVKKEQAIAQKIKNIICIEDENIVKT